jgi:hypothetical protein
MSIAEQEALINLFKQVWVESTAADRQIVQLARNAYFRYGVYCGPVWETIPYLRRAAELTSNCAAVNKAVRIALDAVETEHDRLQGKGAYPLHYQDMEIRAKIRAIFQASPFRQQQLDFEAAVKDYLNKELSGVAHLALASAVDLELSATIPLLGEFTKARSEDPDLLRQQLLQERSVQGVATMERILITWVVSQFIKFEKTLEEPEWSPPDRSDRHYWAYGTPA